MTDRSFKLSQQIEHNESIDENELNTWYKYKKKVFIFFELYPFENLNKYSLISQKLLQLGASNLDS